MHATDMRKSGQTDDRIFAVAAWRDAPYFTDEERAALALTEHATRLADQSNPVPTDVFDAAAKQFSEPQLASLVLHIALINAVNRIKRYDRPDRWRMELADRQASRTDDQSRWRRWGLPCRLPSSARPRQTSMSTSA